MKKLVVILCAVVLSLGLMENSFAKEKVGDINPNFIRTVGCLCGEDEASLGAVSFLGYCREMRDFNNIAGLEKKVIKTAFNEAYLIVPKYIGTEIIVRKLSYVGPKNDKFKVKEGEVLGSSKDVPVMLYCNDSSIVPNTIVYIKYNDETIKFIPNMKLSKGELKLPKELEDFSSWLHFTNTKTEGDK